MEEFHEVKVPEGYKLIPAKRKRNLSDETREKMRQNAINRPRVNGRFVKKEAVSEAEAPSN